MGFLSGIKNVAGFLTILPVGMDSDALKIAAEHMYLFPFVGALIGLLGGCFGWFSLHVLPPLVTGILVFGFIALLSGFNHTDGLLDFGDGIMAMGSPQKKIEAMRDKKVGTGGVALGLIVFLTTAFCIAELGISYTLPALVAAEVSAKFSMVVVAIAGKSAHEGMNTYFVNAMHGRAGCYRFLVALIASMALASIFSKLMGPIAVVAGIAGGLMMVAIAHRHFKGVTGDVFGAANEITRAICIAAILVMIRCV
jgi:adenosylcobinamide-GDP ribazoletransferase